MFLNNYMVNIYVIYKVHFLITKIYLYIFSLSLSFTLFGQQEPLVTNFMFNKLNYNPAATGIDDGISATLIYRNQWDKVVGAPNTTFFNIDANLNKVFYGNYGLTFMNDVIGNFRQNNLLFNFGAPFQIKEAGILNLNWINNIYISSPNLGSFDTVFAGNGATHIILKKYL